MAELWRALLEALRLIFTFDPEVMQIAGLSLLLAASSCVIAAAICLPLGSLIHFNRFPGKGLLVSAIQAFYSVPTVAVGLFVFVLVSGSGPLGGLDLVFTPAAIVFGQVLLVLPLMLGLTISALRGVDRAVTEAALSLGAGRWQMTALVLSEARYAVVTAIVMGFSRAISEVGVSLIVGGNIRGFTRTITTAISLESAKGDIELSLALGLVLIFMALLLNFVLSRLQHP